MLFKQKKFDYTVKELDSSITKCWLLYTNEYIIYQLMFLALNNHISHRMSIWLVNERDEKKKNISLYIYKYINSIVYNYSFILKVNQKWHLHLMEIVHLIGRIHHILIAIVMIHHHQIHPILNHLFLHPHHEWWCFQSMINNNLVIIILIQFLLVNNLHKYHHRLYHHRR